MARGILIVLISVFMFGNAHAILTITASQDDNDVIFDASGSLLFGGLTSSGPTMELGQAGDNSLIFGPSPGGSIVGNGDAYIGTTTGPTDFIGGSTHFPDLGGVDLLGIANGGTAMSTILVPIGYFPGTQVSSSMVFFNTTLADFGLVEGTSASWEWGGGPIGFGGPLDGVPVVGDRITLNVVPEPSAFLFGGLVSLVAAGSWWVKRKFA